MKVWRLLACVLVFAGIEPGDGHASPTLDSIEVFDTVCLKTKADVSAASSAATSLGMEPRTAFDEEPPFLGAQIRSPWEGSKLERVTTQIFDPISEGGAFVSVEFGSLVAKMDDGRRIYLRECAVAEMTRVAIGEEFGLYMDEMERTIAAGIEAELVRNNRQEDDWRIVSWDWSGSVDNEEVLYTASFKYEPAGDALILNFWLQVIGEMR